jgi:hypothetical protein
LLEETGLTLTLNDLTVLSNNPVRVSLREGKHQRVYVFSASIPVPFAAANIHTPAKIVQDVNAQSTINHNGNYVVQAKIDIDGLSLTPTKTGRQHEIIRKFESFHFDYVAQWENFYRALRATNKLICHEDMSLLREFFLLLVFKGRLLSCVDVDHKLH